MCQSPPPSDPCPPPHAKISTGNPGLYRYTDTDVDTGFQNLNNIDSETDIIYRYTTTDTAISVFADMTFVTDISVSVLYRIG